MHLVADDVDDDDDDDDAPRTVREKREGRAAATGSRSVSLARALAARAHLRRVPQNTRRVCPAGGGPHGPPACVPCVRALRAYAAHRLRVPVCCRGANSTTNLNDTASAARRSCTEVPLRVPPPCQRGVTRIVRGCRERRRERER